MRIEPAPSVPCASGPSPAATAAPAPPLERAGRAVELPRVARRRAEQVVGHVLVAQVRRVGLAEDDRAGRRSRSATAPSSGTLCSKNLRAEGGAQAGRRLQVLDRDGHAVQRSERVAAGHRRFGRAGGVHRPLGVQCEEGVQRPVQPSMRLEDGLRGSRPARPRGAGSWPRSSTAGVSYSCPCAASIVSRPRLRDCRWRAPAPCENGQGNQAQRGAQRSGGGRRPPAGGAPHGPSRGVPSPAPAKASPCAASVARKIPIAFGPTPCSRCSSRSLTRVSCARRVYPAATQRPRRRIADAPGEVVLRVVRLPHRVPPRAPSRRPRGAYRTPNSCARPAPASTPRLPPRPAGPPERAAPGVGGARPPGRGVADRCDLRRVWPVAGRTRPGEEAQREGTTLLGTAPALDAAGRPRRRGEGLADCPPLPLAAAGRGAPRAPRPALRGWPGSGQPALDRQNSTSPAGRKGQLGRGEGPVLHPRRDQRPRSGGAARGDDFSERPEFILVRGSREQCATWSWG